MHRWYQESVQTESFNFEYLLTTRLETRPIPYSQTYLVRLLHNLPHAKCLLKFFLPAVSSLRALRV
jgi:hypothetical protein